MFFSNCTSAIACVTDAADTAQNHVCGLCRRLQSESIPITGSSIPYYDSILSVLLVISMAKLMHHLGTAYRKGYEQHQRTLQEFLANTDGSGDTGNTSFLPSTPLFPSTPRSQPSVASGEAGAATDYIDPVYYTFTQVVSYVFVLEASGYLLASALDSPVMLWRTTFFLCNFCDNFVCIHLCRLRFRPRSSIRSAKLSLFATAGVSSLLAIFLLGLMNKGEGTNATSNKCDYCGPHIPCPAIKFPYALFSVFYFLLSAFVWRRSQGHGFQFSRHSCLSGVQSADGVRASFALFLCFNYTLTAVGIFILDRSHPHDAGYCLINLSLLSYSLFYAPLLLHTFKADSKNLREQRLLRALTSDGVLLGAAGLCEAPRGAAGRGGLARGCESCWAWAGLAWLQGAPAGRAGLARRREGGAAGRGGLARGCEGCCWAGGLMRGFSRGAVGRRGRVYERLPRCCWQLARAARVLLGGRLGALRGVLLLGGRLARAARVLAWRAYAGLRGVLGVAGLARGPEGCCWAGGLMRGCKALLGVAWFMRGPEVLLGVAGLCVAARVLLGVAGFLWAARVLLGVAGLYRGCKGVLLGVAGLCGAARVLLGVAGLRGFEGQQC
ncbi:hypothetical protein CYMTET_9244 [Cymbomonas tetramitiformis]|uniref:Uncharacterized protein n=1 Tax=Cymbomonas tetramitiformis TaxID=36881 RepID=A0AAE0GS22_9CHLO|nr:hypothetical protein CYMTET_9244 [Cymbomonas tetramitiformis]